MNDKASMGGDESFFSNFLFDVINKDVNITVHISLTNHRTMKFHGPQPGWRFY